MPVQQVPMEKRQGPRVAVKLPVRVKVFGAVADEDGELIQGYTLNLSELGVAFVLPKFFPVGSFLQVSIDLPTPFTTIPLKGQVIWATKLNVFAIKPSDMAIGVGFNDVDADDLTTLHRFIRRTIRKGGRAL
ncbi:MAG: PilZ domain-containing protein [Elusimicrobia bacterium]|nr:PilZ domain-containing protein [Elusimicrobiota bacterium]